MHLNYNKLLKEHVKNMNNREFVRLMSDSNKNVKNEIFKSEKTKFDVN